MQGRILEYSGPKTGAIRKEGGSGWDKNGLQPGANDEAATRKSSPLLLHVHRNCLPYGFAVLHGRHITLAVAALAEDGEELGIITFDFFRIISSADKQDKVRFPISYCLMPFLLHIGTRIELSRPIFAGRQSTGKKAVAIVSCSNKYTGLTFSLQHRLYFIPSFLVF